MSFQKSSNTAGGLAKLFLLRLVHFQGIKWVAEYNSYALNDVSSYLEQIYFTQDTGGYGIKRKKGAYQVSVEAIVPGSSTAFDELEATPFLLIGLTHNKEYILFGDANNYFIYDYNQDSGSDFTDLAQTKIDITRDMMLKPRLIRNPFSYEVYDPENVVINGVFVLDETLTAGFTVNEILGQYAINYSWYIADDNNGTNETLLSSGASPYYIVKEEDKGKQIRVSVRLIGLYDQSSIVYSNYYPIELLFLNNFYLGTQAFDITVIDQETNHYLFQGKNYAVSGAFTLLSSAVPIEMAADQPLYISFDYKVNADTFYDIEGWPADYIGPYSIATSRYHDIEVSSQEINTWISVSGYITTNSPFTSFMIKTGIVPSIPPEVSLEIRNLDIHT